MSANKTPITKPSEAFKRLAVIIQAGSTVSEYGATRAGYYVCLDLAAMRDENMISRDCYLACVDHIDKLLTMPGACDTVGTYLGYLQLTNKELWNKLVEDGSAFYAHKHAWVLNMAAHFEALGQ